MLKILNKYLLKKFFIASLSSLILIVMIFSIFSFLEELTNNYDFPSIIKYLINSLPVTANMVQSLAILVGSIFVTASLISNSELQIFISAGISLKQFIKTTLIYTFSISVIFLIIGESFSPYFFEKAESIKAYAQGKFYSNSNSNIWLKRDRKFINIEKSLGNKNFEDVTIFEFDSTNKLKNIQFGNKAFLDSELLKIEDPIYVVIDNQEKFIKLKSLKNQINSDVVTLNQNQINSLSKDLRSMGLFELFKSLYFFKDNGIETDKVTSELFNRLLKPFNLLGMFLIAIPFVISFKRNKSINKMIFLGIIVAITFNLVNKVMAIVSLKFGLNIYITSILPTLVTLTIGLVLLKKKLESL